ncbi:MAG: acetylxylan esterase [Bacteroidia bacterium]|nr:MAG: acetylxylan esterase [Bacteroidia bacterium]
MLHYIMKQMFLVLKKVPQNIICTLLLCLFPISLSAQKESSSIIHTSQANIMYKMIEFPSEGATLRGRLYMPENKSENLAIVIMAHGYSATIEGMVADRYAEVICEAGFAVLLYDHRNLGISGGEPRQQINIWTQARGYRDAIDYVTTLPEIDTSKIALWGDSMSGGEVIVVAAIDHRVKAVVVQVPALGGELPPIDADGRLFNSITDTFLHGNVEGTPETTIGPMPVVSFDQNTIPSILPTLTAYRWFIEYGGRYNTKWENTVTHVVPNVPVKFNSLICIPHIKAALLMEVAYNDEMVGRANSEVSRHAFEIAPNPKKLVEVDGGHFGIIHYPSPLFDKASKAQVDFLQKHLI